MDIEKKLKQAYRESVEHLESISAFELMKKSAVFTEDLKNLVDSQHLPPAIIIGCLMNEMFRLNIEPDNILLDNKLAGVFTSFKKYMDETFMKKE